MSNSGASMAEAVGQSMQQGPDNNEVDMVRMVEMFDTALSSDDPAIKELFQKLLMMSVLLTSPSGQQRVNGPFARVFRQYNQLEDKVRRLENQIETMRGSAWRDLDIANVIKGADVSLLPPGILISKKEYETAYEALRKEKVSLSDKSIVPNKYSTLR